MKWVGLLMAALLITACFFTWVSVEGKNFSVGGFYSTGNHRFGSPGLLHVFFCVLYILFVLINRVWSVRLAFFIAAFNMAWAVRNFILISACSGGVCPEKHTALYVILIGSILLIAFTIFAEARVKKDPPTG
jgi:hypothetical protein